LIGDSLYVCYSMQLQVQVDIVPVKNTDRAMLTKSLFTEKSSDVFPRLVKGMQFVEIDGNVFARLQVEVIDDITEVWQVTGESPVQIQDAAIIEQVMKAEGIGASGK